MIEMRSTVRNEMGIHCRPSAVILKVAKDYQGDISVTAPAGSTDLQSVLELISLGLVQGTDVAIRVSGQNEEHMCRKLVELFETHFDFPPRDAAQARDTVP